MVKVLLTFFKYRIYLITLKTIVKGLKNSKNKQNKGRCIRNLIGSDKHHNWFNFRIVFLS